MMVEQKQRSLVAGDAAQIVSRVIQGRHKRSDFFSSELFADAAWDILLNLFLARIEGRSATIADIDFSCEIPASTAERWIAKLEMDGWIRQKADPAEPLQPTLELSGRGARAMQTWLKDWVEHQPAMPDSTQFEALLNRIERSRREG